MDSAIAEDTLTCTSVPRRLPQNAGSEAVAGRPRRGERKSSTCWMCAPGCATVLKMGLVREGYEQIVAALTGVSGAIALIALSDDAYLFAIVPLIVATCGVRWLATRALRRRAHRRTRRALQRSVR